MTDTRTATGYDAVPYPSAVYPQTHPDRLATIARLFGLEPAPVDRARVLELGCGDGANLITMAYALPGSQFYGLDLAATPIGKGNQLIQALGLANITLRQLDLLDTPADLGSFDYILAHGLYSWVPAEARDRILAICGNHLAEHGVAYVSYNAYPGNHLRDLVRRIMRFHVQHFSEPMEQVRQARSLIKFAAEAKSEPGLWQDILKQELERIARYTDAGFFHDDLSAINQPFYFCEFMEQAARHRLQYLAEADLPDMLEAGFTEAATALLHQLDRANIVAREQYLDFLKGRAFRQTLLCRQEHKLDHALKPDRAADLLAAGEIRPVNPAASISSTASEDFAGPRSSVIATSHPVVKAALVHLGKVFPRAVPFHELLALAQQRCGSGLEPDNAPPSETTGAQRMESRAIGTVSLNSSATLSGSAAALAEFMVRTYAVGFLELHSHAPHFLTEVSGRPAASALARLQIEQGDVISTLRHQSYKLEGALSQTLLRLLDGTHDRPALLARLSELVRSGVGGISVEGKPISDLAEAQKVLADQLEANLQLLAKAGVLVG